MALNDVEGNKEQWKMELVALASMVETSYTMKYSAEGDVDTVQRVMWTQCRG